MAPADPNAPKGVFPTAHGIVKSISGSQLFVEVDEDHEMKFRLIHKTKIFTQSKDGQGKTVSKEIKASSLEPGQTVDIDMQSSLGSSRRPHHLSRGGQARGRPWYSKGVMSIPNVKRYRITSPDGSMTASLMAVLPKDIDVNKYLSEASPAL